MTPPHFVRTRFTAISRRRSHQVALRNLGVSVSSYDLFHVADPGPSRSDPSDDQLLPIYNRAPDTFGLDRYELSNSAQPATFHGVTVIFDRADATGLPSRRRRDGLDRRGRRSSRLRAC